MKLIYDMQRIKKIGARMLQVNIHKNNGAVNNENIKKIVKTLSLDGDLLPYSRSSIYFG